MRFLADIPDEDVKWLDRVAREQGRSRAAILREAVAAYRAEAPDNWIERGFGHADRQFHNGRRGHADAGRTTQGHRRRSAGFMNATETAPFRHAH